MNIRSILKLLRIHIGLTFSSSKDQFLQSRDLISLNYTSNLVNIYRFIVVVSNQALSFGRCSYVIYCFSSGAVRGLPGPSRATFYVTAHLVSNLTSQLGDDDPSDSQHLSQIMDLSQSHFSFSQMLILFLDKFLLLMNIGLNFFQK